MMPKLSSSSYIRQILWLKTDSFLALLVIFLSITSPSDATQFPIHSHINNIANFEVSNVQNRLLIATRDGQIYIGDLSDSTIHITLESGGNGHDIQQMRWSVDDKIIAIGFSDGLGVWNAQTGESIYFSAPYPSNPIIPGDDDEDSAVTSIAISPDNQFIATASQYDSHVLLHDLHNKTIARTLDNLLPNGEATPIQNMAFNADGSLLAITYFVGGIAIWDMNTYERKYILSGEVAEFSPDGLKIASSEGRLWSQIWVWDAQQGGLIQSFTTPLMITQLKWSSDNQVFYTLSTDAKLVHDGYTYTGQGIRSWTLGEKSATLFALEEKTDLMVDLETEEILIGFNNDSVLLWNVTNNQIYRKNNTATQPQVYPISVTPFYDFDVDETCGVLIGLYHGGITFWNIDSGEHIDTIFTANVFSKSSLSSALRSIVALDINHGLNVISYQSLCS